MITVLGKLADTEKYIGKSGYSVYAKCPDWTPTKNFYWLVDAVARGDDFLIVSRDATGQFRQELQDLLDILELGVADTWQNRKSSGDSGRGDTCGGGLRGVRTVGRLMETPKKWRDAFLSWVEQYNLDRLGKQ